MAAFLSAKYCENNNVRFIIDIQDLWPEGFKAACKTLFKLPVFDVFLFAPFHFLANSIYKRADVIIAVSDTYANRALRVSNKCKTGYTVFLGTDLDVFDSNVKNSIVDELSGKTIKYYKSMNEINGSLSNKVYIKQNDEIWLAYCGTLGASYDLNIVFDAMRICSDKRLRFIVMGNGEKRKEFEKNAEGLKCVFTGRLPYSQMCGLLSVCDIAVNPIIQGSAISVNNKQADYVAAGLPVLNTQECEEYRNLVFSYNMGFNCDNRDARDLTEKLRILVNDENLRTKMGRNARRCAEERFDRAKTYELIRKVISEASSSNNLL